MRTKKFEQRINEYMQPLSKDWQWEIHHRVPLIEFRTVSTHQVRRGKMYRKVANARLLLNDYWIGIELCQDRDHLDFFYIGITPDEQSDQCLDLEYDKALVWHRLATN
jgi:hypothetical protein